MIFMKPGLRCPTSLYIFYESWLQISDTSLDFFRKTCRYLTWLYICFLKALCGYLTSCRYSAKQISKTDGNQTAENPKTQSIESLT